MPWLPPSTTALPPTTPSGSDHTNQEETEHEQAEHHHHDDGHGPAREHRPDQHAPARDHGVQDHGGRARHLLLRRAARNRQDHRRHPLREELDAGLALLRPPLQANPRAITAAVYTAVFQRDAKGTERQMSSVLKRRMSDGDIGLIADEAHHCGVTGAQQLRYLWDDAHTNGNPFPLLLIGCDVRSQLAKAEEVQSRVGRWVHFDVVTSLTDLRAIATALHPRLAVTSDDVLMRMNDRIARRSLRNWHQIGKHIKYLPDTDPTAKALTATEIQYLRDLTGIDETAAA